MSRIPAQDTLERRVTIRTAANMAEDARLVATAAKRKLQRVRGALAGLGQINPRQPHSDRVQEAELAVSQAHEQLTLLAAAVEPKEAAHILCAYAQRGTPPKCGPRERSTRAREAHTHTCAPP